MEFFGIIVARPPKIRKCEYDYKDPGTVNYNWAWLCPFHTEMIKAKQEAAHERNSK